MESTPLEKLCAQIYNKSSVIVRDIIVSTVVPCKETLRNALLHCRYNYKHLLAEHIKKVHTGDG